MYNVTKIKGRQIMSVLYHVDITQNQFVWVVPDRAAVPALHNCDQSQLQDLNPGPVFTLPVVYKHCGSLLKLLCSNDFCQCEWVQWQCVFVPLRSAFLFLRRQEIQRTLYLYFAYLFLDIISDVGGHHKQPYIDLNAHALASAETGHCRDEGLMEV